MGSTKYRERLGLLLLTNDDVRKLIEEKTKEKTQITALNYLLKNAEYNEGFLLELNQAFSTFIKEEVLLLPKINSILIGPASEKRLINEANFEDFQTILRIQNRRDIPEPPPENETAGERKMREKRELREKVKRQQQQREGTSQELVDLLEIAEVFGIDYLNKSVYAFYGLITRHQLREKYQQDIQMICAGADVKKIKVQYWGGNPNE